MTNLNANGATKRQGCTLHGRAAIGSSRGCPVLRLDPASLHTHCQRLNALKSPPACLEFFKHHSKPTATLLSPARAQISAKILQSAHNVWLPHLPFDRNKPRELLKPLINQSPGQNAVMAPNNQTGTAQNSTCVKSANKRFRQGFSTFLVPSPWKHPKNFRLSECTRRPSWSLWC